MGLIITLFCALAAAFGGFLFGYDSGVISETLVQETFVSKFHLSSSQEGGVVSVFAAGAFFGAAMGGWLADRYGRVKTIIIGAIICTIGSAMQAAGQNFTMLLFGRLIAGFSIGQLSMIVPMYQAEISPPKHRGFLSGLQQQMLGLGFIVSNWVGYGSSHVKRSSFQWQFPLAMQCLFSVMLVLFTFFLPESPRYLIKMNREAEAKQVLQRLHYDGTNETWINLEYTEIMHQINLERFTKVSLKDFILQKKYRHYLILGCLTQIFSQCTGINVINYYGPTMYKLIGYTGHQIFLLQSIYGVVGPIANLIFITCIIDRFGRKRPLIFGSLGLATVLLLEFIVNTKYEPHERIPTAKSAQITGIAMIWLASIIFSLSWGPVSWVYVAEIFPFRIRAMGNAISTMSNWSFNVLFAQVSPPGLKHCKYFFVQFTHKLAKSRYYLLFVVLNIVSAITVFLFFPETKGKSLEEMDDLFAKQVETQISEKPSLFIEKFSFDNENKQAEFA